MNSGTDQLAQTRFDNAMTLFDEFVRSNVKHADAATLRGLEGRFALRLQIQPSYWSQIKARSRQIGERLARQFELLCRKAPGWMDEVHGQRIAGASLTFGRGTTDRPSVVSFPAADDTFGVPEDDDERFIVGLVLTYYRRHPQRARTRLLDLLGEVLTPPRSLPATPARTDAPTTPRLPSSPRPPPGDAPADDPAALWTRSQTGVAPLKRKR